MHGSEIGLEVAQLCCVCMDRAGTGYNINWLNIFTHTDSEAGRALFFLIGEVSGRVVRPHEDLPELICPSCLEAGKTAFNFKRRFEKSLQCLSELMEQKETSTSLETLANEDECNRDAGSRPFQCSQCSKSFSRKNNRDRHFCIHSGEPEPQKATLDNHPQHHTEDQQNPTLNIRLQTQTGPQLFECCYCSKTLTRKSNLQKHLRTHTGERPFKCSQCLKTFIQKRALEIHLRTHTGERPFECTQCSKSFMRKDVLDKHFRIHTGDRPFECAQCSRTFNRKGNLEKHLGTHTGERPFKCTDCPMSFRLKEHLKDHLRTHTGERPFKCSQCSKTFGRKRALKRHISIHTEELLT